MPESSTVSSWLTRVLDWPQSLAQLFGSWPDWLLLVLIFVPSLIALGLRIWHFAAAILMLNALIALSATAWPAGELRTLSVGLASALILALIGQGLRQRTRDDALARIETQLDTSDARVGRFLEALDRRAQIVEDEAVELAKIRLRNEAAIRRDAPRSEPPKPQNPGG
jgi:hypothetical protein